MDEHSSAEHTKRETPVDPVGVDAASTAKMQALMRAAGLTPEKLLQTTFVKSVWQATTVDGEKIAVQMLNPTLVGTPVAATFRAGATRLLALKNAGAVRGALQVHAVLAGGFGFVSDLWALGTVAELSALRWDLDRRLDFFRAVGATLVELGKNGIFHAAMCPTNVLFDDDLKPVLDDVALFEVAQVLARDPTGSRDLAGYVAPEVRTGTAAEEPAVVYCAGALLHWILCGEAPPYEAEPLPRLFSLAAAAPPGLARIVRRCLCSGAAGRYATVAEVLADLDRYATPARVGVGHPEVSEEVVRAPATAPPAGSAADRRSRSGNTGTSKVMASATGKHRVKEEPISPKVMGRVVAIVGGVVFAGAVGAAISGVEGGIALTAVAAAGAMAASTAVPVGKKGSNAVRAGIAVAAMLVAMWSINRATSIGGQVSLNAGDPKKRVDALRNAISHGQRNFEGINLEGADLSKMTLAQISLERANLKGAVLTDAFLNGSNLRGASIAGANLSHAFLVDTIMSDTDGSSADLEAARCTAGTILPSGWKCVSNAAVRAP